MHSPLQDIHLNFNAGSLTLLNLCLAFIMFGIALSLKVENFREVAQNLKSTITGITSQFVLLPLLTFLLVWFANPLPGLAAGMILVAACPGGNISNFFTMLSKGNLALSISLSAISTILSTFMTPMNFGFWSGLLPFTDQFLAAINLDLGEMIKIVFLIMGFPLLVGIAVAKWLPKFAKIISQPIKILSVIILFGFIIIAFYNNFDLFLQYFDYVIYLVLIHNALALSGGYLFGKLMKLPENDIKTISIETGIQNSGLGLVIIFNFFEGNGGMAIITAWWGIWHIVSGFAISQFYSYKNARLAREHA
ncbi:bile acid:sodium symporter family protein [Flexithrix dorotheae]|uniref:bile acid:sodium symporter family protein n=1 Tax=Flexithrix dorotheae TaxID=70993 RepID=UPI0003A58C54|nr:bile acid:sodium symporter family protein [Flexithrix dorotheae]